MELTFNLLDQNEIENVRQIIDTLYPEPVAAVTIPEAAPAVETAIPEAVQAPAAAIPETAQAPAAAIPEAAQAPAAAIPEAVQAPTPETTAPVAVAGPITMETVTDKVREISSIDKSKLSEVKKTLDELGVAKVSLLNEAQLPAFYAAINEQDKRLVVADYKFGMGIAVEAKNNAQLMLYAAGAMAAYEKVGLPVEMITLSIIQPRIYDKALTTTMFKSELLKWVNDTLLPGIALARSDNAEMTPGTEQCRWCSAAAHGCTGQNEALKKLLPVATGGLNIDTVDEDTLSTWLSNMGAFEQALKGIKQTAINRMLSGRKIKGFKLVLTQPREQWADLKKAEGLMKRNKIKESERFKKKLITPKQTEKKIAEKGLLTPRKLNALRRLVITPKGTPTYAPENDKRETYEPPIPMDALPDNSLDLEGLL